jgi:protein tyrosine phosphatase (PTP) superfamily phosphohydrolase (DUF442 family)
MTAHFRRITTALLLYTALALPAPALADDLSELTNYRAYSPMLSSSGQPSAEQLEAVRDAGFERVVFLALTDSEGSIENEDSIVKGLGMEFVHIPVIWESPTPDDVALFLALMSSAPEKKTLVHCQVNFRASTFSFLYRVLHDDVPVGEAKDDLNSVWVPDDQWKQLIFDVLEENGVSPDCDTCLWE